METIYVSIASYRDKQCNATIQNLYKNARYPQRIFVGIVEQNKEENETCIKDTDIFNLQNQVKKISIGYKEALGPWYARKLVSTLYNNEKYYLQIDSHTWFVKDWDVLIIEMFDKLIGSGVRNPAISYYPNDISNMDKISKTNIPVIKNIKLEENSNVPMFAGSVVEETNGSMKLTRFAVGGFLFGLGADISSIFKEDFDGLFMGEEFLMSLLLYTKGVDVYSPNINIVFHEYTRANSPKYWADNPEVIDNQKIKSEKKLIDFLTGKLKYIRGLGDERKHEEFLYLTKVNYNNVNILNVSIRDNFFCKFLLILFMTCAILRIMVILTSRT
jgi:[Skp1-protein]-hydroxyproline N-acetylglucosaminyltransferase